MSDYIDENFRNKPLFYARNHPTGDVLRELTCRILKKLSINTDFENTENIMELDQCQELVYPSVYSGLGLKWRKKWYRDNESAEFRTFSEEAIRYLSYTHDKKEE